MMDIIIFGAGNNTKKIVNALQDNVNILSFIDNDQTKRGRFFENMPIQVPQEGLKHLFDFVVIAVQNGYEQVEKQLDEMGVPRDKIIAPFSFDHEKYAQWRKVLHIEDLVLWELNQRMQLLETYTQNLPYEILQEAERKSYWFPRIMDWRETIREIKENNKSISRFGDGEFDLILGRGNLMQENDKELAARLKEVLTCEQESLLVAIPDIYGEFVNRTEEFKNYFRKHLSNGGRAREYELLDPDRTYYDAFITRPYKDYEDKSQAEDKFHSVKGIWKGRDITIIEGEKTRIGVGNDLLDGTNSVERVICPATNAFRYYDEILQRALKIEKNRLILIALGATATVLAYDLSKAGRQALDIGHIDIEYEWFLCGAQKSVPVKDKYVNEAPVGRNVSAHISNPKYNNEITCRIGCQSVSDYDAQLSESNFKTHSRGGNG